jgi:tRNA threonylcarbamoyladenosine biosynthesis protein TsaB
MVDTATFADGVVIGIEAATPAAGVAIASAAGQLLGHVWCDQGRPASNGLLDDLDRLMRSCGVAAGSVAAVAVSHGPGAFTGLRVGLAMAKTMAHTWGCPLFGFSTLAALARRWPVAGALVCPLLDARRGEVYAGVYRIAENDAPLPERVRADRVELIETLIADLLTFTGEPVWLAGSGAAKYREALTGALGNRARWIAPPLDQPAADAIALAGAAALRRGEPGLDPLAAGPIYLRASDAEQRHGIFADIPLAEVPAP